MKKPAETLDTKTRILDAAGRVFAESGFREATVREICKRAHVNVAAVNYHFRDKKGLYCATLKYWHEVAYVEYPSDPSADKTHPPEERLTAFIRRFLDHMLGEGEGSLFSKLMAWEYIRPAEGVDLAVEEGIKPALALLAGIIGELVDGDGEKDRIRLISASIVGQCLYFVYGRPVIRRLFPEEGSAMFDRESIVGHIARFSLCAIKGAHEGGRGERL